MGIIDLDVRLGDILDIGTSVISTINKRVNTKIENIEESNREVVKEKKSSENIVVKCPGCGYKNAIIDGDGVKDRCEYCGTIIGN